MVGKIGFSLRLSGFILFALICAPVPAQEGNKGEDLLINMRYESFRVCSTGDLVVYSVSGGENKIDRLEIKILEHNLDQIKYQTSAYGEGRLIEEKTAEINLKEMKRYLYASELKKEGIEFSNVRETFQGTIYTCQRFQYQDGSAEIVSDKIPAGGLLRKMDPQGKNLQEILDFKEGRQSGATISAIKEQVIKPEHSGKSATTVSELLTGIRKEREQSAPEEKKGKGVFIGNVGKPPADAGKAASFTEEVVLERGVPTDKFYKDAAVLLFGFNWPKASAEYHVIETLEPAKGPNPPAPTRVNLEFAEFYPSKDEKKRGKDPAKGLFIVSYDDTVTSAKVSMDSAPFPEMKSYELPVEAVTVIPGTINCLHIRLVTANPMQKVKQDENVQTITLTDKKFDYWIGNVKECNVVVKKIETEREKITHTSLLDTGEALSEEERTRTKKWTLIDFRPPQ
jgi:hypothetical protein